MPRGAKEALDAIINELEEEIKNEQIKNNRLTGEINTLKNKYARLVDIITEGGEICRQLKM